MIYLYNMIITSLKIQFSSIAVGLDQSVVFSKSAKKMFSTSIIIVVLVLYSGASFEGAGGPSPLQGKRKKRKQRKKEKREKKKKKRKKGTMNNVKLLHIKCCFFPIFQ